MATKTELEAEVIQLRAELAREQDRRPEMPAQEQEEEAPSVDWERDVREVLETIESLPEKQPVLLALGALAVGYLIGRSR
ncbi:hypothetical protein shim_07090 [Shimia sp. SK013]|uniref:hypothetical protein n=1 Tax=Shimia sp. SK013 TaxID=1389006 RepID=UPI0006B5CBE7|nr:hypothetical protein [Shimia sp. SK013]KPA22429.1 hypothetical protein shim_07090 [Shimia sp. SK013]